MRTERATTTFVYELTLVPQLIVFILFFSVIFRLRNLLVATGRCKHQPSLFFSLCKIFKNLNYFNFGMTVAMLNYKCKNSFQNTQRTFVLYNFWYCRQLLTKPNVIHQFRSIRRFSWSLSVSFMIWETFCVNFPRRNYQLKFIRY